MPIKYDEFIRRTAGKGLTAEQKKTVSDFSQGLMQLSNNVSDYQNAVIMSIGKLGADYATILREEASMFKDTFNTVGFDTSIMEVDAPKEATEEYKNRWNTAVENSVAFFNTMLEGNNFKNLVQHGHKARDQAFGSNMENYFAFIELLNRCYDAGIDIEAHKKKFNDILLADKKNDKQAQPKQEQEKKEPVKENNEPKFVNINAIEDENEPEIEQPEAEQPKAVINENEALNKLTAAIDAHKNGELIGRGSDAYDSAGAAADKVKIHLSALYKFENTNLSPEKIDKATVDVYEEYLSKLTVIKQHLTEMHEADKRYIDHKKTDKRSGQWADDPEQITNKNARKRVKAVNSLEEAADSYESIISKKIKATEKVIKDRKEKIERDNALIDHNEIAHDKIIKLKDQPDFINNKEAQKQVRDLVADIIASSQVTHDEKKNLRDKGVLEEVEQRAARIKEGKALNSLMEKAVKNPRNLNVFLNKVLTNNTSDLMKMYNTEKNHFDALEKQGAAQKATEVKPAVHNHI